MDDWTPQRSETSKDHSHHTELELLSPKTPLASNEYKFSRDFTLRAPWIKNNERAQPNATDNKLFDRRQNINSYDPEDQNVVDVASGGSADLSEFERPTHEEDSDYSQRESSINDIQGDLESSSEDGHSNQSENDNSDLHFSFGSANRINTVKESDKNLTDFNSSFIEESYQHKKHITISRDHTSANFKAKLFAIEKKIGEVKAKLKARETEWAQETEKPVNISTVPGGSNHALQDYQMQLMLLEQQNKKRLMMARAQMDPKSSSETDFNMEQLSSVAAGTMFTVEADTYSKATPLAQQITEQIRNLQQLQISIYSTTWQVFYKIKGQETTFLEKPSWVMPGDKNTTIELRGNSPIGDEVTFLQQKPEVAFVVYKHFIRHHQDKEIQKAKANGTAIPEPIPQSQTIILKSAVMIAAVDEFLNTQPNFHDHFPTWDSKAAIPSPFLFWYYYRSSPVLEAMQERNRSQMRLLGQWIDQNYSGLYAQAEELFTHGLVSESTMPFLIKPGEVIVSKGKDNKAIRGNMVMSWTYALKDNYSRTEKFGWKASTWSYGFDGCFYQVPTDIHVTPKFDEEHPTARISTLEALPLRFASPEFRIKLERRGSVMWNCRYRTLVAYENNGEVGNGSFGRGERYMVDFKTYRQLHSDSALSYTFKSHDRKEMSIEMMESSEPPQGNDLFVFPSTLTGYNLRLKAWQDLQVDQIHLVIWDKQAFEYLVIDSETKELIEALVTTKVETDQGTDMIQGKGNGLIILLHGGPGTGKTFTAESVAEFAEKPLFRVTCGDVGTKPEEVEKYLESVLYLGRIWGCVVLLDEADVFLEQRTLTDLDRNALVSVFLRVLEYYEGIMILTSNRVGTFDEAFKSRIQLSLHYEPLSKSQRHKIWKNFFNRLKSLEGDKDIQRRKGKALFDRPTVETLGESKKAKFTEDDTGIDFDDIDCYLTELAEEEMNGRQIRNAITTARQLARFQKTKMSSTHLKHVMKVSRRFDKYLEKVREGLTDEQIARSDGIR